MKNIKQNFIPPSTILSIFWCKSELLFDIGSFFNNLWSAPWNLKYNSDSAHISKYELHVKLELLSTNHMLRMRYTGSPVFWLFKFAASYFFK